MLGRCINPIIKDPEPNKEVILRRNVFKSLYKYASFAFNRNLLVKRISSDDDDEGKLLFMRPVWVTPNVCVVYLGFFNIEALERNILVTKIQNYFMEQVKPTGFENSSNSDLVINLSLKNKNLSYVVYQNRVSSLLISLPLDIVNMKKKHNEKDIKSRLELMKASFKQSAPKTDPEEDKLIPKYIFQSDQMNVFNFIPYKSVRIANNFRKKWIWVKDNNKIIADFIKIIARHRICEGFELVHTCNDDMLFIKTIKLEKLGTDEKIVFFPVLIQYLIKYNENDSTFVKTEVYMEKENGRYSVKNKKVQNFDTNNAKCEECECHNKSNNDEEHEEDKHEEIEI